MEFYPKDTVILHQNGAPSDSLRIIKKGGVKVWMLTENGNEVVIDYRSEGDMFGFLSMIGRDRVRSNITAVDDTICYLLGKDMLLKLLDSHLSFTEFFLKSHITRYIDRTYREMRTKSVFYSSSDHLLFTTPVGDIVTKDVVTVRDDATIREAAAEMSKHRISSLIITDSADLPLGVLTDCDLREKVVARGRSVNDPVKDIMSLPLVRVDAKDYCFEAMLKMIKHNVHHILVIREGKLKGVLTNHDLMLLQGASPLSFARDMESQETLDGVVSVSMKIDRLIGSLLKEGARASSITRIISEFNDRLARKVLEFGERKFGKPPTTYCWLALGSEGRREQACKENQDNALVYADPASDDHQEAVRTYFAGFTRYVREGLKRCGFPLSSNDDAADGPASCRSIETWKKDLAAGMLSSSQETVRRILLFVDLRCLAGDHRLAEELRSHLWKTKDAHKAFMTQVAAVTTADRSPLGFFKTFIVEKDGAHKSELDLTFSGIGPLVDVVRLMALESRVPVASTLERIEALQGKHPTIDALGDELSQAFEFLTQLRIHHQVDEMERGALTDNYIDPGKLSNLEKRTLKESFKIISKVQDALAARYRLVASNV